jgi:hypothetical protein
MAVAVKTRSVEDLNALLGTWRVLPQQLLELRRLHARAINEAVATECARALRRQNDWPAEAGWGELARQSTWTTPHLAFAHCLSLRRRDVPPSELHATAASLRDVCRRTPPLPEISADHGSPVWLRYGLLLVTGVSDATPPSRAAVAACARAQAIMRATWPEMALAVDSLVRQVVWHHARAAHSVILVQTYGAVYLACEGMSVDTLHRLVRVTTSLEVVARRAVDTRLVRPGGDSCLSRALHSAMIAKRTIEAMDRSLGALPATERDRARAIRRENVKMLDDRRTSLQRVTEWTPIGSALYNSLAAN